jgi:cell division septum initiation protein DivIVA
VRSDIPLEELERVAILYDSIRDLHKKLNPTKDQELARDFDQHLQRVMKSLYQSVQSASVPEKVKTVNGLKAKYDLYDICLSKLNELLEQQESESSEILKNIHNGVHNIISSFYDVLLIEEPREQSNHGSGGKDLEKYQNENKKLIRMIDGMESEMNQLKDHNDKLKKRHDNEKSELKEQIASLENENKMYLDTLIKRGKGEATDIAPLIESRLNSKVPAADSSNRMPSGYTENERRTFQKSPPKIPKTKEFTYSKYSSGKSRGVSSQVPGSAKRGFKTGGVVGQTTMRNLSLKQMKDIINDIYTQKVKYDQKCEENKLPRETMEQYMYTYLNQRYGLKNLIIEWAASVINGIKKYSKDDHSVMLFGKILRNE